MRFDINDNDIVKALELCRENEKHSTCEHCSKCPFSTCDLVADEENCLDALYRRSINLINRQKAEIERLTSTQEILKKRLDNCLHFAEENVEFEKENRDLLLRLKQCDTEIESLKIPLEVSMAKLGDARAELQKAEEEIERKDRILESYALQYGTVTDKEVFLRKARTEAIKEFAELLKEIDDYVSPLDIDNLVKEMTEETS